MPMSIRCFADSSAARGVATQANIERQRRSRCTGPRWTGEWSRSTRSTEPTTGVDLMTKHISGELHQDFACVLGHARGFWGGHHVAPKLHGQSSELAGCSRSPVLADNEHHPWPRHSTGNQHVRAWRVVPNSSWQPPRAGW